MKKLLIVLLALAGISPLSAQIIPPRQSITAVSSGITVCTTGNCATWPVSTNMGAMTAQLTGTMTSMTVTFEGTADGTTWLAVAVANLGSGVLVTTATALGQFAIPNSGLVGFRVRCTTYSSGGINVSLTRGVLAPLVAP